MYKSENFIQYKGYISKHLTLIACQCCAAIGKRQLSLLLIFRRWYYMLNFYM